MVEAVSSGLYEERSVVVIDRLLRFAEQFVEESAYNENLRVLRVSSVTFV